MPVRGKWQWRWQRINKTTACLEIGDAFGGRDHTTVLHACRKWPEQLREESHDIKEDFSNLIRTFHPSAMKFIIEREQLLKPPQQVSGPSGGRPTLPILGNLLLKVTENTYR